ncbi:MULTISPECIES: hypothetical protein [Giesbergeria]|uniref:Curli production assembly/transport component CsgG n=1 Tax=Giesbergeria sinuosa TaxID=80883 RepID=A0ABV9QD92_9BURK
MQRRSTLAAAAAWIVGAAWVAGPASVQAQPAPRIAVTDLAYTPRVSEYFEAGTEQGSSHTRDTRWSSTTSEQYSSTYVAGRYSYIEQRQLYSFTNDIKGALLRGTVFRLVQGKAFDAGAPQPTKAEQALHQLQTGRMARPSRQPEVRDIIARIKKGEFNGADYVLFGAVSSVQFRDALSPLQGTSSATHQYGLDLLVDFSLIHTRTYEIKAAFSAQGAGNDTKILSNRGDIAPPNRAKVMRETSQSLAMSVYEQLVDQLGYSDPRLSRGVRPPPLSDGEPEPYPDQPPPPPPVTILR